MALMWIPKAVVGAKSKIKLVLRVEVNFPVRFFSALTFCMDFLTNLFPGFLFSTSYNA